MTMDVTTQSTFPLTQANVLASGAAQSAAGPSAPAAAPSTDSVSVAPPTVGFDRPSSVTGDAVNVILSPMAVAMENAAALQGATPDTLAQFMANLAQQGLLAAIMNIGDSGSALQSLLAQTAGASSSSAPGANEPSAPQHASIDTPVTVPPSSSAAPAADPQLAAKQIAASMLGLGDSKLFGISLSDLNFLNVGFLTATRGAASFLLGPAALSDMGKRGARNAERGE